MAEDQDQPPGVRIESADNEDVNALVELWIELASDQRRHGSHLDAEANRSVIHQTMLQHVVTETAFLAEEDGEIVGFATFEEDTGRYRLDVSRGIIHNIYVRAGDRGRGIGSELLAAVEATLQTSGVDVVSLQAMAPNDRAVRFYRRHGYEPHRIELEKSISNDPER